MCLHERASDGRPGVDYRTVRFGAAGPCSTPQAPVPTAKFTGSSDCQGRISGDGYVNPDGMEGMYTYSVNGAPAIVIEGYAFRVVNAAQPFDLKVFAPNGSNVPVELSLVGPVPGSCEQPPVTTPPSVNPPTGSIPVTGGSLNLTVGALGAVLLGFLLVAMAKKRHVAVR